MRGAKNSKPKKAPPTDIDDNSKNCGNCVYSKLWEYDPDVNTNIICGIINKCKAHNSCCNFWEQGHKLSAKIDSLIKAEILK